MALAQELPVDELLERVLEKTGTLDALEAERTIEARGRIENLQELVGVAREYRQQTADASLAGFLQDIALVSDQDTIRDDRGLVTLMTLHNAKGLEFRAVFVIGMEEGIFPHVRADRGAGRRGGASPLLRRHDARDGAADADAHDVALALRAAELQPRVALPRRAADRGRARAAAAVLVERLRLAGERGAARRRPDLVSRPATPCATPRSARASSPPSSPGGVVTIRFAEDGTERRLMIEYAPLERIA